MLDDPGRVRSQIATVVCQIQRFDLDGILILKDHFDCILILKDPICTVIFQLHSNSTAWSSTLLDLADDLGRACK